MNTTVQTPANEPEVNMPRSISVHVNELKRANPDAVVSVSTTLDQGQPSKRQRDIILTAPKLNLEKVAYAATHRLMLANVQSRRSGKNTVVILTYNVMDL